MCVKTLNDIQFKTDGVIQYGPKLSKFQRLRKHIFASLSLWMK